LRCWETTILLPAEQPNFLIEHWQKYNKTITALCVGKHPDLSTLWEQYGCFPAAQIYDFFLIVLFFYCVVSCF
jgi:hypothetical protein